MSLLTCKAVGYDVLGDPRTVISLRTIKVDTHLEPDQVLVKWIASPLNPADFNLTRGVYFYKRNPPAVLGIDAFGIVEKVGVSVSSLQPNDHVMPLYPDKDGGYWREYHVIKASHLYKFNNHLNDFVKCSFGANAATAYLMLKLFESLEPGDYVIQNSANSQVGRAVIEIAQGNLRPSLITVSAWNVKTINLVRNRVDIANLKTELLQLGASFVFTEDEFKKVCRKFVKSLDRPLKLGISGVGGKSTTLVSANLTKFGTLLVYGGMGMKPHEILTSSLVFNSIKVIGFQLYDYFQEENEPFRRKTYDELQELYLKDKLHAFPMQKVPLEQFKVAVERTLKGNSLKQLLIISKDTRANL